MPLTIAWTDIALRLALTVMAGLLIGFDRSERGKVVGMRTTVLVCLAASVAMIQVNLLLPTAGRAADSFVMNDLMRLPLGILTGVGFIGGGAILHRDNIVVGVTTAATLWLVTVIGLCLGGGQIGLGLAATAIGFLTLWALTWLESRLRQDRRGYLTIDLAADGPNDIELRRRLAEAGFAVVDGVLQIEKSGGHHVELTVRHARRAKETVPPAVIRDLVRLPGVERLRWRE